MQNKSRAFTLIELLVVILIIGILAAVAVPQYQKAVLKSRFNTLKILAKSVADAQEIYYMANNTYATSFDELAVSLPGGQDVGSSQTQYFYDWGNCQIITTSGYDSIECKNKLADMSYQIRLQHATINPNSRKCITHTSDLNDVRNQICKAETQAAAPSCCPNSELKEWAY